LLTVAVIGVADVPLPPAAVGTALAVIVTAPLVDGFQEQVATMLGDVPVVALFLQPGMMEFRALKVTFAAALTFAVIVTAVRNEALPLKVSELNMRFTGILPADIPKLYLVFK
jgi:hypothetical protein